MLARLLGWGRAGADRLRFPPPGPGGMLRQGTLTTRAFPERLSAPDTTNLSPFVAPWLDNAYLTFWAGNQLGGVGQLGAAPQNWIVRSDQANSSPAQRTAQAVGPAMSGPSTASYLERMRAAWQMSSGPRPNNLVTDS